MQRLRLAYYSLGDPNPVDFGTRLTLLAKNSPPDCFLNAQTLTGSSPDYIKTEQPNMVTLFWCRRRDLNPHERSSLVPETSASAIPPLLHIYYLNIATILHQLTVCEALVSEFICLSSFRHFR